jgi:hypothetical protein
VLVGDNVTLWTTNGTQIGAVTLCAGDCYSNVIAPGAFRIPKGGAKTLVLKGDISPTAVPGAQRGLGYFSSSGVGLWSNTLIEHSNADFHIPPPLPIRVVAP